MKTELVKYNPGHFDQTIPGESLAVIVGDGDKLEIDGKEVETKDLQVFTKAGVVLRTNVPHEDDKIEGKGKDAEGDKEHHAFWTE